MEMEGVGRNPANIRNRASARMRAAGSVPAGGRIKDQGKDRDRREAPIPDRRARSLANVFSRNPGAAAADPEHCHYQVLIFLAFRLEPPDRWRNPDGCGCECQCADRAGI